LFFKAAGDFGLPAPDVPLGLHERRADPAKKAKKARIPALQYITPLCHIEHIKVLGALINDPL
jgi:hypothetical protein